MDEVKEMIVIPRYKSALLLEDALVDYETVELPERVVEELTNYVSTVSTFYYDPARNPFHNFMHASHVLASVVKMMERIVSPSQMAMEKDKRRSKKKRRRKKVNRAEASWEELHDHTFGKPTKVGLLPMWLRKNADLFSPSLAVGITTDPLTQFAVVFAALIHDLGRFAANTIA